MSDVKEFPDYSSDGPIGVIDLPDETLPDNGSGYSAPRPERLATALPDSNEDERPEASATAVGSPLKRLLFGGAALVIVVGGALTLATHGHPERLFRSAPHIQTSRPEAYALAPTGKPPAVHLLNPGASGKGGAGSPSQTAHKQAVGTPVGTASVETLSMVAMLGVRLQEMGQKDQALAAQLAETDQGFQAQLASLNAKVGQLEASDNAAIAAATKVASTPPAPVEKARIWTPAPASAQATIAPSSYSVEAASPGVAIVVRDGAAVQVGVGDTVPGVGKVTSIEQSGTGWTVHTTGGEIE